MNLLPNLVRTKWSNNDKKRDKSNTIPDNLIIHKDITYAPSSSDKESFFHLTDIYRPTVSNGLLPVIVNVHGGGWFYGDKEVYRFYSMHLAAKSAGYMNSSVPTTRTLSPASNLKAASISCHKDSHALL